MVIQQRQRKDLATARRRVEGDDDEERAKIGLDEDSYSEDSIQEDSDFLEGDQHFGVDSASLPESPPNMSEDDPKQRKPSDTRLSGDSIKTSGRLSNRKSSAGNRIRNGRDKPAHLPPHDQRRRNRSSRVHQASEVQYERRRREHGEYIKKRDEDPSFVPNRGEFFMHDHRDSGPAANGFRPFGRGKGRGKAGFGGSSNNQKNQPLEPFDAPWTHDMHEIITKPVQPKKNPAPNPVPKPPNPVPNPDLNHGHKKTRTQNQNPVNVAQADPPSQGLSGTKFLGTVTIRVSLPAMPKPLAFPGTPMHQYIRLPDHRPPLRRDKPVRISLPKNPPLYIHPSNERSFVFIPRTMRPNHKGYGGRGRGRSVLGSVGGYSRRTSVYGGSTYGSTYSTSIAMSRRSSLANEYKKDIILSPVGSTISRPQMIMDSARPVVRLPPTTKTLEPPMPEKPQAEVENTGNEESKGIIENLENTGNVEHQIQTPSPESVDGGTTSSQSLLPEGSPRESQLPSRPQPGSQGTVSVSDVETPSDEQFNAPPQQKQQPFHQQVPPQVSSGTCAQEAILHSRKIPYPVQVATGPTHSQIPECAIHAQPFQPNLHPHQLFSQPYHMVPQFPGYYYPQSFNSAIPPPGNISSVIPTISPSTQSPPSSQLQQSDNLAAQSVVQNLVAQEANGMVYYYDPAHIPAVTTFSSYQQSPIPLQPVGMVGMGVMAPNPDAFYYSPASQGIMYYPQ